MRAEHDTEPYPSVPQPDLVDTAPYPVVPEDTWTGEPGMTVEVVETSLPGTETTWTASPRFNTDQIAVLGQTQLAGPRERILRNALTVEGAIAIALGGLNTGRVVACATRPGATFDPELAVENYAALLRAKSRALYASGSDDHIEDIATTVSSQCHLCRVVEPGSDLFVFLALERSAGTLAMSRRYLQDAVDQLVEEGLVERVRTPDSRVTSFLRRLGL